MIKRVAPRGKRPLLLTVFFIKEGILMVTKKELKDYASKLMFSMSEEEYETLESEFVFLQKQMDKIANMDGIDNVEPLVFPKENKEFKLRDDEIRDYLTVDEVLANSKHKLKDQIKVPRVVQE